MHCSFTSFFFLPIAFLLLGAPAPAQARSRPIVDYSPDLSQPEARARAQLDILESMVRGGMVTEALNVAAELRAAGVKGPRLDLLQARAMHAQGLTSQAAELLRGVVKAEPRNAAAWSVLGIVLLDAEDVAGALAALERAHRLAPDDPQVLNNLGFLEMTRGRNQRSIELLTSAIVQDPSNRRTRNNLGFALARMDRDTEALAAFRAAGSEADALYDMGLACEIRGDMPGALTHYQAARLASPAHTHAAAAIVRLLHTESP